MAASSRAAVGINGSAESLAPKAIVSSIPDSLLAQVLQQPGLQF